MSRSQGVTSGKDSKRKGRKCKLADPTSTLPNRSMVFHGNDVAGLTGVMIKYPKWSGVMRLASSSPVRPAPGDARRMRGGLKAKVGVKPSKSAPRPVPTLQRSPSKALLTFFKRCKPANKKSAEGEGRENPFKVSPQKRALPDDDDDFRNVKRARRSYNLRSKTSSRSIRK
ncbi:hypothetical protein BC829DRAFT_403367 [Chytridium lagenaria]|nr:hypothetical protein BC829DRAFT_403367 [Chytridium lagenaria]